MSSKFKIIVSGIFFAVLTILVYLLFRIDLIEKDFVRSTTEISKTAASSYKNFTKVNEKPNAGELSNFLNTIYKIHPNIAVVAITDMNYSIKVSGKNDNLIQSRELYNSIVEDISGKKFSDQAGRGFISRYYEVKKGTYGEEQKFYIFNSIVNNGRLIIMFPYTARTKILIKISLEILLIILFYVIITAAIYLISRKKTGEEMIIENINIEEGTVSTRIDLDSEGNTIELQDKRITKEMSGLASDNISSYIFDVFTGLRGTYGAEDISLYLKNSDRKASKCFEYKGKSFIKIDSATFDTIDLDSNIGNELKKSAVIFLNGNRKVVIPIMRDESLIGIISLIRELPFTGEEIRGIRNDLSDITSQLSDYLVVNRVMVDALTGLYSKAYYQMKYNELMNTAVETRKFSVMFLSLFSSDIHIGQNERVSIIKILAPVIAEKIGKSHYLCIYDEFLGIILPDISHDEALQYALDIKKIMSKYRIKIDRNLTLQVSPKTGTASTDSAVKEDITGRALKNMH